MSRTSDEQLDISANRSMRKYSRKEQVARVLWGVGRIVFFLIPRPLYGCRWLLLRGFGAQLGKHVQISNTADIFAPWNLAVGDDTAIGNHAKVYNLTKITIGRQVTISQGAHLCGGTHDYRDAAMPLIKAPIVIEDKSWVCADAFVGPNVRVGVGAIVGARAVAMRDVAPWTIVAGNPAEVVRERKMRTQK